MKNFSLLLALRYLNPLRTHVSVITLISLIGVSLGVMVLIVVLSVMAGFEDVVKSRVLGQSPHITVYRTNPWEAEPNIEAQWRPEIARLKKLSNVTNAYPLVRDFVLIENETADTVLTAQMQGIDTENMDEDFLKLIIEGDGDVGMGSVAIISSVFAEEHNLGVDDKLEVISNRNLKQLRPILDMSDTEALHDAKKTELENTIQLIRTKLTGHSVETRESMSLEDHQALGALIDDLHTHRLREEEQTQLKFVIEALFQDEEGNIPDGVTVEDTTISFPKGTRDQAIKDLEHLKTLDALQMDKDAIDSLSLQRDVVIKAIFQADRYSYGPQIYFPLNLAQEMAGTGDTGNINGIALKVEEPYKAHQVLANTIVPNITSDWAAQTWMKEHEQQFSLISSQKSMMVVALSFIVLIAIFSIGAVMFTITIQKKREIGVMKALGATQWQVMSVFTLQGLIVGFFGALFGFLLSLLVLNNLDVIQSFLANMGFNPFPKSFTGSDTLPHIINKWEVLFTTIGAFILCTLAALFPAWLASRTDAARSLRNI